MPTKPATKHRAEAAPAWPAGDADALAALGKRFVEGKGVPKDVARGLAMLVEAVDLGTAADHDKAYALLERHATAQLKAHRRLMAERNAGRPKGEKLRKRRAPDGRTGAELAEAAAGLEELSLDARGKRKKALAAEAEALYRQAAELGDMDGQAWLSTYLALNEDGTTREDATPEELAEAARWCRLAAEQGHAECMFIYGYNLLEGEGVAKDPEEAVYWFDRTAKLGFVAGFHHLAMMYERGTGVPRDMGQAIAAYFGVRDLSEGDDDAADCAREALAAAVAAERARFEAELARG